MASTSSGTVSPPKRGRPKSDVGVTRIQIKKDVFDMWIARKSALGFATNSHSEFAKYLLLNFDDEARQSPRGGNGGKSIIQISYFA